MRAAPFADWRYLGSFTADGEWLEAGDAVNVDLFKLLQATIRSLRLRCNWILVRLLWCRSWAGAQLKVR